MNLQARTVLNSIAGALGGFLAWILIDLTGWFHSIFVVGALIVQFQASWWLQILLCGIVGGLVGVMLGLVNALGDDSAQRRLLGTTTHASVGFLGGAVGVVIGQTFYGVLAPHSANLDVSPSPGDFIQGLIARAIGWAFIGAGVGLAQGVARRSKKLVTQGLFGGFAGGLIGGVLFQCAVSIVDSSSIARLLGFVSIGASTGFFIGLIQTLFRQAWVRVVLGRNEGKEYLIDKPVFVIGRSELADIGLFGNPRIMPHQCAIEQVGGRYLLKVIPATESTRRGTAQAEVKVNGQVVNPDVWLADGDAIVIDDRSLQFREKLARRTEEPRPKPVVVPAQLPLTTLTIIAGPNAGMAFSLNKNVYSIGRTEDCGICLKDDTLISRKHAILGKLGDAWSISDSQSANGTFVNGDRLSPSASRRLTPGDRIKVGETELSFS